MISLVARRFEERFAKLISWESIRVDLMTSWSWEFCINPINGHSGISLVAQGFGLVTPDPFSSREQGGVWAWDYAIWRRRPGRSRLDTGGGNLIPWELISIVTTGYSLVATHCPALAHKFKSGLQCFAFQTSVLLSAWRNQTLQSTLNLWGREGQCVRVPYSMDPLREALRKITCESQ